MMKDLTPPAPLSRGERGDYHPHLAGEGGWGMKSLSDKATSAPLLIAKAVWLEILRREEYLALLILMGLYLVFAVGARLVGNTQTEAVALMLNMGLWLSSALAAVLTLLTSVRAISKELETRSIYPLLAKPVHRGEIVLGKFLAGVSAGCAAFAIFIFLTALTWTARFPLPGQDPWMLLQALILQLLAFGLLASFSLALSLVTPTSVAILISGFLYFAGTPALNLVHTLLRDSTIVAPVKWVLAYIPSFSHLCLLQRFTDGAPALPLTEWLALLAYGVIFTLGFLVIATKLFERRAL